MPKPDLKVLDGDGAKRPPAGRRRVSVAAALESGDELELLKTRRMQVARMLDNPKVTPTALAALNNRFDALDERIKSMEARHSQGDAEGVVDGGDDVDLSWSPDPS